jgi:DNA polymerase
MQEALATLQWYIDAGVDEAIDDAPRNYFAAPATQASPPPAVGRQGGGHAGHSPALYSPHPNPPPQGEGNRPAAAPASLPLHHTLAAAIAEARKLADGADTLEALREAVQGFEGCAIKRTATKTVFSDGNPEARIMLVGEAPGAQEDAQGIPFCGPSGWLLDKMMAAIGYDRTRFYITNTVFWRPPGNRQPNTEELTICKPFVERHVALIDPLLLVMVGGTATKAMLATEQGITRLRGKRYTYRTPYRDKDYPVAVIYHPSYLLRQPAQKRATWQDLLAIKAQMEALSA